MICEEPYVQGIRSYGCGKCLPCLRRRRGQWTHRILLEALEHKDNAFVTLTYDDDNLPKPDGIPTLVPADLRNWLKRIRKSFAPRKLRFYAVGEYGDESERPHFHAVLFGYPTCLRGATDLREGINTCCSVCSAVQKTWPFGAVHLGRVEPKSASYICGYVLKKMTTPTDMRLGGRFPEFARMSLKPGIGAGVFLDDAASVLMQWEALRPFEDVPTSFMHGKSHKPLGRYLRKQLRKRVGRDEKAVETKEQVEEMLAMHARSVASKGNSVGKQLSEESEGRIRQIKWNSENLGKRRVRL